MIAATDLDRFPQLQFPRRWATDGGLRGYTGAFGSGTTGGFGSTTGTGGAFGSANTGTSAFGGGGGMLKHTFLALPRRSSVFSSAQHWVGRIQSSGTLEL